MATKPAQNQITKTFETWGEYLQYVSPAPKQTYLKLSRNGGFSFTGTHSFEEALNLAHSGWVDGAEEVKKISEPIFTHISSMIEHHDIVNDVEGIQVDIARYLDNEPECWQQWESKIIENPGTKIIKLIFNGAVSSGISKEVINRVGATVTALVELLEYSGTRVEIVYEIQFRSGREPYLGEHSVTSLIKLKSADQPLDVPRLAFAFGHPSSLRRLGFSFLEQQPEEYCRSVSSNYGNAQPTVSTGDIVLPPMDLFNKEIHDVASAEKWIINQLKLQGIELKSGVEYTK